MIFERFGVRFGHVGEAGCRRISHLLVIQRLALALNRFSHEVPTHLSALRGVGDFRPFLCKTAAAANHRARQVKAEVTA
jgi:hypothetical protein